MAIISNETWDKFTQEEKESIQSLYRLYKIEFNDNQVRHFHDTAAFAERKLEVMDVLIGEENLQPKSKINTWKDVLKAEGDRIIVESKVINPRGRAWGLELKYHQKAEATLKLAILIELGYGGTVTEEDNKDQSQIKYFICPRNNGEMRIIEMTWLVDKTLGFYSRQQAEEFMSYSENVQLIKDYYML